MTVTKIISQIKTKKSFLCVGLDPDMNKLPKGFPKNSTGIIKFNTEIIKATQKYAIAYKLNLAFYECLGLNAFKVIDKTLANIPSNIFTIADAKRGDIDNTAIKYAETFFKTFSFDSLTINPYMGLDSIKPYLNYKDKVAIVLGLTSNTGAFDFQTKMTFNLNKSKPMYWFEYVINNVKELADYKNLMFVVGATQSNFLKKIRKIIPEHFLLVPGIGVQGGNLEKNLKLAVNKYGGLVINVGREIIYAGHTTNDFNLVYQKALSYQKIMEPFAKTIV